MKIFLIVSQIVLSLVLSALIFLQSQNDTESRSNILSNVNVQKRGWEKTLFIITLILLAVFLLSSIIQTLI